MVFMSHETLAVIWFGLWAVLWILYFILDGYTLGTGMLFSFISKDRKERSQLQEAIGPFWGGNEVWLITAGGATFAAFPTTYANMFSYLYTPLMLILFALFFRAAGLEFMHKDDSPRWQNGWRWAFSISSYVIALLFGVAFANLYYGLKVGADGYEGTLFSLLHPYGVLGGLLFISLFLLSGSLWIQIKTSGVVARRAARLATPFWYTTSALFAIFLVASVNRTTLFDNYVAMPMLFILPVLSLMAILSVRWMMSTNRILAAWLLVAISTLGLLATGFVGMFPNMLPARDPQYSLTLFEAMGSRLNLSIMLVVAIIFVPVILAYQLWAYKLFKSKIHKENAQGYDV